MDQMWTKPMTECDDSNALPERQERRPVHLAGHLVEPG